jgi:type III pantothenate kinase
LERWQVTGNKQWVVSGVNPQERDALVDWLKAHNQRVTLLTSAGQLPLTVKLEHPDRAGIDRLLNAVAANTRRPAGGPAGLVDAGSAVTVDWLDEMGAFCGGAIFPGLHLMSAALHNYTALLPLVEIRQKSPPLPGRSTREALEAGVFWSTVGGINTVISRMAADVRHALRSTSGRATPAVFVSGGDGSLLSSALDYPSIDWPEMTLEGLRLAALRW